LFELGYLERGKRILSAVPLLSATVLVAVYSIGMTKSLKYQREPARKQASRRRPEKDVMYCGN
jgi:hypothetical protein